MEWPSGSMEQSFIVLYNQSRDGNILFVSASITEILGWEPYEVQDRSCFDYMHPDEVSWAREVHGKGVKLREAASLRHLRLQHRDGRWISCECYVTVVEDIMVGCTRIYRRCARTENRAINAQQIRRRFRYHPPNRVYQKFNMLPDEQEPRAALILNRFTRTLSIMFATDSIAKIHGLRPEQLHNKSFYDFIASSCLADAVRRIESAKSNDSIAYLRFMFRDPRTGEESEARDFKEIYRYDAAYSGESFGSSNMDTDGGADPLHSTESDDNTIVKAESKSPEPNRLRAERSCQICHTWLPFEAETDLSLEARGLRQQIPSATAWANVKTENRQPREVFKLSDLEAVVLCTSDGLVVVLRNA